MKSGEDNSSPRDGYTRYTEPGDEITLADYLQVLWKWKWLIVIGTLAVVALTIAYVYQLPRVYEVSAVVEPGLAGLNDRGDRLFLDNSDNIASKINEKTYNRKISEELNLEPEQWSFWPEAKTDRRTKSNIVRVLIESPMDQADRGKEVLSSLIRMIASDYEKEVNYNRSRYEEKITLKRSELKNNESKKKDIDRQIEIRLNSIKMKQNEIQALNDRLDGMNKRIEELYIESGNAKANTDQIISLRKDQLSKPAGADALALLLYSNTIQQNIAYFNGINDQIYLLKTELKDGQFRKEKINIDMDSIMKEVERMKLTKEGFDTNIEDIQAQIGRLESEEDLIGNLRVIQAPQVSLEPVGPKKIKITALAVLGSLFGFMMLAFFLEYLFSQVIRGPRQTSRR